MYRVREGWSLVFLAHTGGPFYVRKDGGYWTNLKGEPDPDEDRLKAAKRESAFMAKTAFDIEYLEIDKDRSRLESLSGKRVGRLVIHVRRAEDAGHVTACKSVDDLELWGWKEPDLTSIRGLAVRHLRMVRGRQTSVKGLNTKGLKKLWVQSCGELRELDIPSLPWLWVWACNKFDPDCLGSVRGLVGLDFDMRREIKSLAFVAACRSLKCLGIDTYAWKTQDFRPLVKAPALELVGFSRRRPAFIEALSIARPKLFVGHTDSGCFMRAGRGVAKEDYLNARKAFNEKYGV
jgi:hypothetical protein